MKFGTLDAPSARLAFVAERGNKRPQIPKGAQMKKLSFTLVTLIALSGCTSEEEQLENAIREGLANQGAVQEVNLIASDENNLTGYAMIRENSGREGRLNCTAQRGEGSNFNWRCSPAIDEATIQEMETAIRSTLAAQAEVVEVEMQRAGDDNHMTGHALLRDGAGNQLRVPCSAERSQGANFNWSCGEENTPAETETGGK